MIVEGPDMVGKTTLMPFLESLVREKLMELGEDGSTSGLLTRIKFGLEEAKYTTSEEWIRRLRPWALADRFALSEMIYGKCSGRGPAISEQAYKEIDDALMEMGGCLIVIRATPERYEELLRDVYPTRGEAFSQEVCRQVNREYGKLQKGRDCDAVIELDVGGGYAQEGGLSKLKDAVSWWVRQQLQA